MIRNNELRADELLAFLRAVSSRYCAGLSATGWMTCEQVTTRVMVAGTYRDVCELIDLAGRDYLVYVFTTMPKSWFTIPARQYWIRHLGVVPIHVRNITPTKAAVHGRNRLTAAPKSRSRLIAYR